MNRKVKLGDVANQIKDKIDKDSTDLEYYIGGEHIDSRRIVINRKAPIKGSTIGPAFHMHFMPGDVLLMSRNPHLCKASMADFEGVCSNVSYVVRTRDESVFMQSLLPFVVQTNAFWKFAEENKRGGMPFFLNWKDFAEFEFSLPSPEKQRKIADLLWAAERTKEAYEEQLSLTDMLVKSQFIEMFGDPVDNENGYPIHQLSEVATSRLGKMLDKKRQTGLHQRKYLANINVQWFRFELNDLNMMDFNEADQKEFSLEDGDLLVCEGGEIGRCAVWHEEVSDCYFQKAIHRVRCNPDKILPEYLAHLFFYHSQKNEFADIVSSKATIAHLPGDKLKAMGIIVPPIDLQQQFVAFVEQSDKSKFELRNSIEKIDVMIRTLSEQTFA